eukprot:Protomagalhaensia_wolfi_Nauph_80__2919@NODE_2_length_7647_cov_170_632755_g1_i0_p8_GENE_NODE_2_length_7647_cov_170_632755_g1_i0NODE_2_length_7647_cov_170_632755_g1_i0_p8_ORF_typecomplete_len122_score27_88C2/PF00168_30/1_9e08_NODE_2_length_7647_cov_170_632755_g1_i038244189
MPTLQITVHAAKDLKAKGFWNFIDTLDPYVTVKIGDAEHKGQVHHGAGDTAVLGDTLTMEWDGSSQVEVFIDDKDKLKDDHVGALTLSTSDMPQESWHGWRDIFRKDKCSGSLLMTVVCWP